MLKEDSQLLVTINTHCRVCLYSIHTTSLRITPLAPAIFQKVMDTLLQELVQVSPIWMATWYVVAPLRNITNPWNINTGALGMQYLCPWDKCVFMVDSVEYLGHTINASGLHILSALIKTVQEAPHPRKTARGVSFLGLVHYYGKFITNLSAIHYPLNSLL